ncbi:hypothetical protein GGQ68_004814 [Sagittula marina]|uniref:Uncharacterized protein n=1 Tax=Sagittula marina TaxID=943940 RepID=A0A7W6GV36_9RHOB|nr:hypothetical protein [Sagittula marina]MBB3988457.1 hypothetical protein [Sagittula marina]
MLIALSPLGLILAWLLISKRQFPVEVYLGLLWLIAVWTACYTSHEVRGFFAKDELYFAEQEMVGLLSNRFLWLFINHVVGMFSLTTEQVVLNMRVFNLSVLILIYLYAVSTIRTLSPLLLAVMMSYFAAVAALNLRDPAILLGTWIFLNGRATLGHSIADQITALKAGRWGVVLVILLRPLQFAQLFISGFRLVYLAGILALALIVLQTSFGTRYFYNFAYFLNNFETVVAEKAEDKGLTSTQPTPRNIAFWTARFAFAPSPTSIAQRLLAADPNYSYGRVDLAARAINRVALYGCFLALLFYGVRYRQITLQVLRRNAFILKFALLFSLTYAIFNFGASHERIKLNVLILVLMLVDRIRIALRDQENNS